MKKTLGGDRLGSGNKMQVELHGFDRSTHDIGNIFRSTMSAGTLVPFLKRIAQPGDTIDIDLSCDVKTHPTVGPLFGSYKVQLDIFQAPFRLYQGQLHNNKQGIGLKMNTVKLPVIEFKAPSIKDIDISAYDIDNYQINPSCIFAYLGIRGIGTNGENDTVVDRYINAITWLMYWDTYKNYYSNKQEEIGAVIHFSIPTVDENVQQVEYGIDIIAQGIINTTGPIWLDPTKQLKITNNGTVQDDNTILVWLSWPLPGGQQGSGYLPLLQVFTPAGIVGNDQNYIYNGSLNQGTITAVYIWAWEYSNVVALPYLDVRTFPLENIDEMREQILIQTQGVNGVVINTAAPNVTPYTWALEQGTSPSLNSMVQSQEGLALKTYQSDLLNNWLSTEWIDGAQGISEITAVSTVGDSFTIDALILSKKVYNMLNRIAVSGGTYDDWMDANYMNERYTRCETPIYHGGLIKELVFQEVVSNSESSGQPLGTLAGKGVMGHKNKGGKVTIKVDEWSYIMGIVSITPRLDYSQGNDWDIHLKTMDDLHKPALDEIGFQELITEQMAWWDTFHDGTNWVTRSAGKQPAWINYMTDINKVRGNFAIKDNEMFMVLNRRYEPVITDAGVTNDTTIKDLTTYIDPRIWNHIFADTALDCQNFWVQIASDITVRRKISAKLMPNL